MSIFFDDCTIYKIHIVIFQTFKNYLKIIHFLSLYHANSDVFMSMTPTYYLYFTYNYLLMTIEIILRGEI